MIIVFQYDLVLLLYNDEYLCVISYERCNLLSIDVRRI